MPLQLDLGEYTIAVSTDGVTYRPKPADQQFTVSIIKCPNGFTCTQEVPTVCPQGYFCPADELQMFQKYECPLGTFMTGTGATECTPCEAGKVCPDIRLFVPQACPLGFLCQLSEAYSVTQLKECPAGYVCNQDLTSTLIPENLFSGTNMQACPLGHYCPKGTINFVVNKMTTHSHYGNSTTPQICRDGILCA